MVVTYFLESRQPPPLPPGLCITDNDCKKGKICNKNYVCEKGKKIKFYIFDGY